LLKENEVSPSVQQGPHHHERVPAVAPATEYEALKGEIDAAVARVLASGQYVGGPEVQGIEEEFARFCGAAHAVAVGNGTDALRFALLAAGSVWRGVIRAHDLHRHHRGDQQAGGRPVFADIHGPSFTIFTPRRAIVPVHLYGQTADMDPLVAGAGRPCRDRDACWRTARPAAAGRPAPSGSRPGFRSTRRRTWAPAERAAW
jgi:hypothetical protein